MMTMVKNHQWSCTNYKQIFIHTIDINLIDSFLIYLTTYLNIKFLLKSVILLLILYT